MKYTKVYNPDNRQWEIHAWDPETRQWESYAWDPRDHTQQVYAAPTASAQTWYEPMPQRPATRAGHSHGRRYSQGGAATLRAPADSPRYNSSGKYATVDVSHKHFPSSRGPSGASQLPAWHDRGFSHAHVRAATPFGESDEDEIFEASGHTYVLVAESRAKRRRNSHAYDYEGIRYTNHDDYSQDTAAQSPIPASHVPYATSHGHHRSSSAAVNVPQRPSTTRPLERDYRPKKAVSRQATQVDAWRHGIPTDRSLKNWDPEEEPIVFLGSVFDANSLGKWIYDWAVFRAGACSATAEMAGDLWMHLIEFSGNVKHANGRIFHGDDGEAIRDFAKGGEYLTDMLRELLKECEPGMLKATMKTQSGCEVIDTLFGHHRQLKKTEKFIWAVHDFNQGFKTRC